MLQKGFQKIWTYMRTVAVVAVVVPSNMVAVPAAVPLVLDIPVIRLKRVLGDLTAEQLQYKSIILAVKDLLCGEI